MSFGKRITIKMTLRSLFPTNRQEFNDSTLQANRQSFHCSVSVKQTQFCYLENTNYYKELCYTKIEHLEH